MSRCRRKPSLALEVLCVTLSVLLAAGPALADSGRRVAQVEPDEDDEDIPVPPTPPALQPPPPAQPSPGPPPAAPRAVVVTPPPGAYAPPNPYGVPPHVLYARGQSLRAVGLPLTIAGIALFGAAIWLFIRGTEEVACTLVDGSCGDNADRYMAGGALALIGSFTALGVGIPLWAVGASRMNRAVRMGYVPTVALPYVRPTHNGLVAGLRVTTF